MTGARSAQQKTSSKESFFYAQRRKKCRGQGRPSSADASAPAPVLHSQQSPHMSDEDDAGLRRREDLSFSNSLELDVIESHLRKSGSIWDSSQVYYQGASINAIPFEQLAAGTNVARPPALYLRVDETHNLHRHAPGYKRDANKGLVTLFDLALTNSQDKSTANVLIGDDTLQAIIDCFALDSPLVMFVHRIGPLIVLDASSTAAFVASTPQTHHEKAQFAKLIYRMAEQVSFAEHSESRQQSIAQDGTNGSINSALASSRQAPLKKSSLDEGVPRIGSLATTGLDGNNSPWERNHAYTNVMRLKLQGNLNILLGVDRPIFCNRLGRFFPCVVRDASSTMTNGGISPQRALAVWLSSVLANSGSIEACDVRDGNVTGFASVSAFDLLRQCGCDRGKLALDFAGLVLRWLQSQCTIQGMSYVVVRREGSRALDLRELAHSSVGPGRRETPLNRSDDLRTQFRRENCVALMNLRMADHLSRNCGDPANLKNAEVALDLLCAGADWLCTAAVDSQISRLADLSRDRGAENFVKTSNAEWESHVGAITTFLVCFERCTSEMTEMHAIISLQQRHALLGLTSRWCHRIGRRLVEMNLKLEGVRARAPSDAETEAAWSQSSKICRMWIVKILLASLRCCTSCLDSSQLLDAAKHQSEGAIAAELLTVAVRSFCVAEEAHAALFPQLPDRPGSPSDRVTTLEAATNGDDATLAQFAADASTALREHCADLLMRLIGRTVQRETKRQSVVNACDTFASTWNAGTDSTRPKILRNLVLSVATSKIDDLTACYRCLALLSMCEVNSPRVLQKTIRLSILMASLHRGDDRLSNASTALARAQEDLLQLRQLRAAERAPPRDGLVRLSGSVIDPLAIAHAIDVEMGLLLRARAKLPAADVSQWDKAVNYLRERCDAQGQEERGHNLRVLLAVTMLEHVQHVLHLDRGPQQLGRVPAVWYSDMMSNIAMAEGLLFPSSFFVLKLGLLTRALNDCTYSGQMGGLTVATILATREHWASAGWALVQSVSARAQQCPDSTTGAVFLAVHGDFERLDLITAQSSRDYARAKVTFMMAMSDVNLTDSPDPSTSSRASPLPSRRRLLREAIDVVLSLSADEFRSRDVLKDLGAFLFGVNKKIHASGANVDSWMQKFRVCVGTFTSHGALASSEVELPPASEVACRSALLELRRWCEPAAREAD